MWDIDILPTTRWRRAIILVDMNAFFASVEQQDYPELRGQPLAITNGEQGTCIITSSYEARAFGIKTGMRMKEAKLLCPHLIQVPARPHRYTEKSTAIMEALISITPDIEIFSIDEAFLDVTQCQELHGSPETIGHLTQQTVYNASGLLSSIGVSGDKTTAKYAAKLDKPNGFNVIPPWEAKKRLQHVPVTELCGIGKGIGAFLAKHDVYTCGDMERLPISILAKRFGNQGRRLWYMCQGADPESVHTEISAPKSMGHGKIMPPNTKDVLTIKTYLMHMCEKLGARLRGNNLRAQAFFVGLRNRDFGWLGKSGKCLQPTDDSKDIYQLGLRILKECWSGEPVFQIQVTAHDPRGAELQLDLLATHDEKRQKLNGVMDAINARYGAFTLMPAPLLKRSSMPNVIAPAWRPGGPRQTI
ncbi:MAG: DNA polymerase IV [Gammaproteobacteria bacterium]|nr:DNA polymerase IV [Gammaproteobacteria bacterium]